MARPRKPTALKVVQGTNRKDRTNPNEPKPETNIPSCPSHLNADAKREWKRITKELAKMNLVTEFDRSALAAYCLAYGTWVEAERGIKKDGMIAVTPNGLLQQSAWLQIRNKALEQLHKYAVEFGFTPASRSKVSVMEKEPEADPLNEFLNRRK